jgi:hypothetical protein
MMCGGGGGSSSGKHSSIKHPQTSRDTQQFSDPKNATTNNTTMQY